MNELFEAIDDLIQRTHIKLWRDGAHHPERHTLPSLWEQLETSIGYSASSGGNGGFGSQSPVSTDVLDLVIEIASSAAEASINLSGENLHNAPDNLRRVASKLAASDGSDEAQWWADTVTGWCARARTALRLDPARPRWARGIPCPECHADTVSTTKSGEVVRRPALAITWSRPAGDEYHADSDWMVRAVECGQCGAVWHRGGGLDVLVEQMLVWNATRETLAVDSA